MTENSLITLYCIVDDFIHRFLGTSAGKKNLAMYYGKRGPKRRMPVADVVTLNLIRVFDRTGDLKTFHKNAKNHYKSYFPIIKSQKKSQAGENLQKAGSSASNYRESAPLTARW